MAKINIELPVEVVNTLAAALDKHADNDPVRVLRLTRVCTQPYNTYSHNHEVKQIFHEVSPGMVLSISTQLWLGGYYFNSDDFVAGQYYLIDKQRYRCSSKAARYIELTEV